MSTAEDTSFEARYRGALTAYVRGLAEEALVDALGLGRAALREGLGLLDLLAIHHTILLSLIERGSSSPDSQEGLARANEFLTQVAAPFEMAQRGWHDMADRLRLANEALEQRVAERTEAHRAAVERLDRAQQIAGVGSWEIDLKTGQQIWSKEMYRICGLPKEATISGWNSILPIHHEDQDRYDRWFTQLAAGHNPAPVEYRISRPDNQHRVVRLDGELIAGADGTVSKISCTLQDITERTAVEAQLHELQGELAHFARLNTIGHMASALAHELNQPLSAIGNYLKGAHRLLGDSSDELSSAMRHALENASDQAQRAGQIVRRLRDFMARHETEFLVESVRKLVEETGSLALVGVKSEGVQVKFTFDHSVDLVVVDRIQIQQVLLNLLRNAIEAMQASEQRKLMIATESAERDMVLISVADTGPGIDAAVAERLFQPFVTSKQHGMGVGLSICRTIIESHGGQIWFDPNPEGGTVFRFTLRTATAEEMGEVTSD